MDYVTLACQLLGGALGALLAAAILGSLTMGASGNALAGIVGGTLGGLILTRYLHLPPAAAADGAIAAPLDVLRQVASGGAGGAVLMILVSLATRPFQQR